MMFLMDYSTMDGVAVYTTSSIRTAQSHKTIIIPISTEYTSQPGESDHYRFYVLPGRMVKMENGLRTVPFLI